jgi:hypothetical protein
MSCSFTKSRLPSAPRSKSHTSCSRFQRPSAPHMQRSVSSTGVSPACVRACVWGGACAGRHVQGSSGTPARPCTSPAACAMQRLAGRSAASHRAHRPSTHTHASAPPHAHPTPSLPPPPPHTPLHSPPPTPPTHTPTPTHTHTHTRTRPRPPTQHDLAAMVAALYQLLHSLARGHELHARLHLQLGCAAGRRQGQRREGVWREGRGEGGRGAQLQGGRGQGAAQHAAAVQQEQQR